MFDPLTAGVLFAGWLAWRKQTGTNFGVLTPDREDLYRNALAHLQDPDKMKALADAFEKEGLKLQAKLLRKRAEWRSRDAAKRDQHEAVYQKALLSENATAVVEIAKAFESMTATAKAARLYEHARNLRDKQIPPKGKAAKAPEPKVETVTVSPEELPAIAADVEPAVVNGKSKHKVVVSETSPPVGEGTNA